jgi:hypothetical protein
VWDTPGFLHVNNMITWVWVGAVTFMTLGAFAGAALQDSEPDHADALEWGSTAVGLVVAFRFTAHYPEAYRRKMVGPEPATT